jgi:hypothetical protein
MLGVTKSSPGESFRRTGAIPELVGEGNFHVPRLILREVVER